MTITDITSDLKEKKYSVTELVTTYLSRIADTQKRLNSFITTTQEEALSRAKQLDSADTHTRDLPLFGIPIALKDNLSTKDIKTTAASTILSDYIPPYNATVVQKLIDAGAVIIGKTNLDAWAHGSSTENSDFGTTKNPWDQTKLPGGSSGGSAAAVASDQVPVAIGTETAGSIRQPAAWCGIVGVKPTYGRVSRYGLIAMASSLDCIGPLAHTTRDASLVLSVIAGHDPLDATSLSQPVSEYLTKTRLANTITIGIPKKYFEDIDPQIAQKTKEAIDILQKKGVMIKEIDLLDPRLAISVYTILQRSEVSSNLARMDGIRFGKDRTNFHAEAKRRIMLGTYTLSSGYYDQYYTKAQKARTLFINDFQKAFESVDVILTPTTPTPALPLGSSQDKDMFGEIADQLVEPSTIAGLPGINIPCGFTTEGLPIGMQLIAPHLQEDLLFQVGKLYEEETMWYTKKPTL